MILHPGKHYHTTRWGRVTVLASHGNCRWVRMESGVELWLFAEDFVEECK